MPLLAKIKYEKSTKDASPRCKDSSCSHDENGKTLERGTQPRDKASVGLTKVKTEMTLQGQSLWDKASFTGRSKKRLAVVEAPAVC